MSVLSSGEGLLLNWLTRSFNFSEGFNKREASLFIVLPGLLLLLKLILIFKIAKINIYLILLLWKLLTPMEKFLLLFTELNGKIWLQQRIQYQGSLEFWRNL